MNAFDIYEYIYTTKINEGVGAKILTDKLKDGATFTNEEVSAILDFLSSLYYTHPDR